MFVHTDSYTTFHAISDAARLLIKPHDPYVVPGGTTNVVCKSFVCDRFIGPSGSAEKHVQCLVSVFGHLLRSQAPVQR